MIEYDTRVGMWYVHCVNKFGRTKRRWFETKRAAELWLAHQQQ